MNESKPGGKLTMREALEESVKWHSDLYRNGGLGEGFSPLLARWNEALRVPPSAEGVVSLPTWVPAHVERAICDLIPDEGYAREIARVGWDWDERHPESKNDLNRWKNEAIRQRRDLIALQEKNGSEYLSRRLSKEQYDALPDHAREWIMDLETRCDHTGELAELRLMQDTAGAQLLLIDELRTSLTAAQEALRVSNLSLGLSEGSLASARAEVSSLRSQLEIAQREMRATKTLYSQYRQEARTEFSKYDAEVSELKAQLASRESAEEAWKRGYIAGADHAAKDLGASLGGIYVAPYISPKESL